MPKTPTLCCILVLHEFRVVFMLYKRFLCVFYFPCCIFYVVWNCLYLTFSFLVIWNWKQRGLAWCEHFPDSGISCNQIRRTWSLVACPAGFLTRVYYKLSLFNFLFSVFFKLKVLHCVSLILSFLVFWNYFIFRFASYISVLYKRFVFFKVEKSVDHW